MTSPLGAGFESHLARRKVIHQNKAKIDSILAKYAKKQFFSIMHHGFLQSVK